MTPQGLISSIHTEFQTFLLDVNSWIWWNKWSAVSVIHIQDVRFHNSNLFPLSSCISLIIFAFCFHNSILPRQYLLWPVPAEHWAFYKYKAWAQAMESSAHADSHLSAALVIGINRMQGKCHAHSWIFMAWCCLLGRLKWWLPSCKHPKAKQIHEEDY